MKQTDLDFAPQSSSRSRRFSLAMLTLLLLIARDASAAPIGTGDDTAIFSIQTMVPPNVMLLLDSSGSMMSFASGKKKITIAKQVVTDLVNAVNPDDGAGGYEERVRFGLAYFSPADDGAIIAVPAEGGTKQQILDQVAAIVATGYTPLSESLVDIARYFTGEYNTTDYPDVASCGGLAAAGGANVTMQVTASSDDVRYDYDDSEMRLGDTVIKVMDDTSNPPNSGNAAGFRWANVPIPRNATILNATIQLFVHDWDDDVSARIYFQPADNPGTFTSTASDLLDRLDTTTPSVQWRRDLDDDEWWTSPDFTTIIQTIVDRPAWVSGNAMVALLVPLGADSWSDADFRSYDYAPSYGAKLLIEYLDPPSGVPAPVACEDPRDEPKFPGRPSPIDLDCRQSVVVAVTDGEPRRDWNNHYGDPVAGTTAYSAFVNTFGNADNDSNECNAVAVSCIDDPDSGRDDGRSYSFDGSDWLDDVAFYMSHTDLVPTLDGQQSVRTYTVGFDIDHPLLSETAIAGQGEYFTATSALELADVLTNIVMDIFERSASFTSSVVPASRTSYGDRLYTAYFSANSSHSLWPGHLESYTLSHSGQILDDFGNPAVDQATGRFFEPRNPHWDAAALLQSNNSRTIYTTDASTTPPQRIGFSAATIDPVDLTLDAGEISQYPNWNSGAVNIANVEDLRDALVNYVYGNDAFDEDTDGDTNERGEAVLGDIFHSTPFQVRSPSESLSHENGYAEFRGNYRFRNRVIYAGANDGMLHAFHAGTYVAGLSEFDEGTGAELFAYVPGLLLSQIKWLPRNAPRQHYYVDLPPTVAEAWLGDGSGYDATKSVEEWATVLIAGFRQGGKGYLALDVTDPSAASAAAPHGPYPKLLWELGPSQLSKLGDSWSKPVITRVKVQGPTGVGDRCGRDDGDGDCVEVWVAIVGGGYERDANPNSLSFANDPNSPTWTDRGKAIYIVRLDNGEIVASVEGDPRGISGPAEMRYAIPSSPAVLDLEFDGFADVVYVGDTGGQVWKWDISEVGADLTGDSKIDNWSAGVVFRAYTQAAWASGPSWFRQIFEPLAAAFSKGDLVLALGTGERADATFAGVTASNAENNRFYVIHDPHPTGPLAFATVLYEDNLTDITDLQTDNNPADSGFLFVAQDGEKFLSEHQIFGHFVITTSYEPDTNFNPVPSCEGVGGGDANLYIFNMVSGVGFFADAVDLGANNRRMSLGSGFASRPTLYLTPSGAEMYVQTSGGQTYRPPAPPPSGPMVFPVYWRQIF